MKTLVFSLLFLPVSLFAQVNSDAFIYPDPENAFTLIESVKSQSGGLAGRIMQKDHELYQAIMEEMAFDFHWQINRVNQCIRNLTGNVEGPNILLLSGNEGGFPRQGITLIDPEGKKEHYPNLHFSDLVLDLQRVERGDLNIYSHEMGHVFMNQILVDYWNRFPNPTSPKQHVSMGITDYLTAFYEGWGVHFQRMAYDKVDRYQQTFHSKFNPNRGVTTAWHSNLDETLRILDVETTNYIYQKLLPLGVDQDTLSSEELILLKHTSTLFDATRIKTAQQLLSCEGVIASLFYHINSNSTLQNNYQDLDFYRPFLAKQPKQDLVPRELFTPFENVLLKSAYVWTQMEKNQAPEIPMIDFIMAWCKQFPDDQTELIKAFIFVTKGKTISNELAALTEQINYFGQVGNITKFRELMPKWTTTYKELMSAVHKNPDILKANVGPELWLQHPEIEIRKALWMEEPKSLLAINLNTATYEELLAFTTPEKAESLIQLRRAKGFITEADQEHFGLN